MVRLEKVEESSLKVSSLLPSISPKKIDISHLSFFVSVVIIYKPKWSENEIVNHHGSEI
jgi:hypothetical protein